MRVHAPAALAPLPPHKAGWRRTADAASPNRRHTPRALPPAHVIRSPCHRRPLNLAPPSAFCNVPPWLPRRRYMQVYVPELIFGHLLTSSNYDDDEKKIVGGRNGYEICCVCTRTYHTSDATAVVKYSQPRW